MVEFKVGSQLEQICSTEKESMKLRGLGQQSNTQQFPGTSYLSKLWRIQFLICFSLPKTSCWQKQFPDESARSTSVLDSFQLWTIQQNTTVCTNPPFTEGFYCTGRFSVRSIWTHFALLSQKWNICSKGSILLTQPIVNTFFGVLYWVFSILTCQIQSVLKQLYSFYCSATLST